MGLSKLVSRNRIIVTLHGDQDTHARLGSALEWWLTDSAVIVSHAAGKTLQLSRHAGKFVVVHNGITPLQGNTHADGYARDEFPAPAGALVGVMVARIDGRKGHTTLLHALVFMGLYVLLGLREFPDPYATVAGQAVGNAVVGVVGFQILEWFPGFMARRRLRRPIRR